MKWNDYEKYNMIWRVCKSQLNNSSYKRKEPYFEKFNVVNAAKGKWVRWMKWNEGNKLDETGTTGYANAIIKVHNLDICSRGITKNAVEFSEFIPQVQ